MAAHIKRPYFKDLATVYDSRWWDYRRLSVGHSFMLFNRHYLKAMRSGAKNFVESRGPQRGANGKVMTPAEVASFNRLYGAIFTKQEEGDLWERGQQYIVGMFKGMLAADICGMPYGDFCRISIERALEAGWRRVPQPWHLYGDRLWSETIGIWEANGEHKLPVAKHPQFLIANYQGTKTQDDYRVWLVEQIKRRLSDHSIPLSVVMFQERQLPLELAELHFSPPVIRKAISLGA